MACFLVDSSIYIADFCLKKGNILLHADLRTNWNKSYEIQHVYPQMRKFCNYKGINIPLVV